MNFLWLLVMCCRVQRPTLLLNFCFVLPKLCSKLASWRVNRCVLKPLVAAAAVGATAAAATALLQLPAGAYQN
jgi:hypothetical protein